MSKRKSDFFFALPHALRGWWCKGEGQIWLYHHVVKREETTQNDVPLLLQHRQGHGAWDYPAMLALVRVGHGNRIYQTQQKAHKHTFYASL